MAMQRDMMSIMTTNKFFQMEYYDDDQAEESDPDPVFTTEADNTEDLFIALSNELEHTQDVKEPTYIFLDVINDSDLRYSVYDHRRRMSVGVAIVIYP